MLQFWLTGILFAYQAVVVLESKSHDDNVYNVIAKQHYSTTYPPAIPPLSVCDLTPDSTVGTVCFKLKTLLKKHTFLPDEWSLSVYFSDNQYDEDTVLSNIPPFRGKRSKVGPLAAVLTIYYRIDYPVVNVTHRFSWYPETPHFVVAAGALIENHQNQGGCGVEFGRHWCYMLSAGHQASDF